LIVVHAPPAVLLNVASVLGHLARLRAGGSVALGCRSPIDRWHAFALRYRDVNCMRPAAAARACGSSSYACGVQVLRAMARRDWPEADSRLAMLLAPDASSLCVDADSRVRAPMCIVDWVDVGRCLSLCCAVVRHAAAPAMLGGGR
jgi:hypothetical protein